MLITKSMLTEQEEYIKKYENFLAVVVYLGGCVFQSQMCRLLFGSKSCTANTRLVKAMCSVRIFKKLIIANRNILVVTNYVLHHFNVKSHKDLTSFRLKLSAVILESYLQNDYYSKGVKALRERMEKSSALCYQTVGEPHLRQLYRYILTFKQYGFCSDGLKYQINRMEKRKSFALSTDPNKVLNLSQEVDLYTLECLNTYISAICIKPDEYGHDRPIAFVDIYMITQWQAWKLAKYIIIAKRLIEETLQNNSLVVFTIHSLNAPCSKFEKSVQLSLLNYPEFLYPDMVNNTVIYKYYDLQKSLFNGIPPDSFI